MKKAILTVIAVLAIGFSSNKLFAQAAAAPAPAAAPTADVMATLTANSDYNAMAVALRAANLSASLKGAGPFTIFAPNNTAFSNLSSRQTGCADERPCNTCRCFKRTHCCR
jgi:uncharacterized surface protein with fasciclin (FAS1) repeats